MLSYLISYVELFSLSKLSMQLSIFFKLLLLLNKQPLEVLLRIPTMLFQGEVSIGISFSVELQAFGLRLY